MTKLVAIAVAAAALSSTASARTLTDDVVKQARKGDVASQYVLRPNGALYRQIGAQLCQVTSDVDDFKIAQHPNDPTAVYLVRKGALEALTVQGDADRAAACPKAQLQTLIPALDRAGGAWVYKVVDRKDTPLSLVAQDTNGRVTAWDDRGVAVSVEGAVEVEMNPCFGTKKAFGSFVAFVRDRAGLVSKIGGKDPRKSKADPARYGSLDAFKAKNNVCR